MNAPGIQPLTLGPSWPSLIDPVKALSVFAWIAFVIWLIYTAIAAYHWLRYGREASVAVPALIAHVIVSLSIAAYAVSGFH